MTDTKSGFSADERAAMKQRAAEIRADKGLKGAAKTAKEYEDCIAAIDALTGIDKEVAVTLHQIVEVTDAVRAKLRDLVATAAGAPEERA